MRMMSIWAEHAWQAMRRALLADRISIYFAMHDRPLHWQAPDVEAGSAAQSAAGLPGSDGHHQTFNSSSNAVPRAPPPALQPPLPAWPSQGPAGSTAQDVNMGSVLKPVQYACASQ